MNIEYQFEVLFHKAITFLVQLDPSFLIWIFLFCLLHKTNQFSIFWICVWDSLVRWKYRHWSFSFKWWNFGEYTVLLQNNDVIFKEMLSFPIQCWSKVSKRHCLKERWGGNSETTSQNSFLQPVVLELIWLMKDAVCGSKTCFNCHRCEKRSVWKTMVPSQSMIFAMIHRSIVNFVKLLPSNVWLQVVSQMRLATFLLFVFDVYLF